MNDELLGEEALCFPAPPASELSIDDTAWLDDEDDWPDQLGVGWKTGVYTSTHPGLRAFLERQDDGGWVAHETDEYGRMLSGFHRLRNDPFDDLRSAQAWVERHVESKRLSRSAYPS